MIELPAQQTVHVFGGNAPAPKCGVAGGGGTICTCDKGWKTSSSVNKETGEVEVKCVKEP